MSNIRTIDELDVAGKRVLVRGDVNVPMRGGVITDITRLDRTIPTLAELADRGAMVIVLSHMGRPKGRVVPELSLRPLAEKIGEKIGKPVPFAADCIGDPAKVVVGDMRSGDIVLLENLRFHNGETDNDADFSKALAELGDVYVSDAFSCAHRSHASIVSVAKLLPTAAGRLMQAELNALRDALEKPNRPVAALVGGAKISTKMGVLDFLARKVDILIIGGGMANTFLAAKGVNVGKSLCEHDMLAAAKVIMEKAEAACCEVVLPVDAVVAAEFKEGVVPETVSLDAVSSDRMILDCGPASIKAVNNRLGACGTLVWNGPMGAFEISPFDKGTNAVARRAAALTKSAGLLSVAGGGDTVAALDHAGAKEAFSYVSTGGGAFLEWLEGKTLPGVAVLLKEPSGP